MKKTQWFEENDQYTIDDALGERTWPHTLGLVRVTEDGKTQSGWSKDRFMRNHARGAFKPERIADEFTSEGFPFGFLMRSLPMLCVDIDGKNGGIEASSLMKLPPTLAERSKSGNGFHLFYRIPEAEWHPKYGYAEFTDSNGIVPGVDIRAVGIVYHYEQQRWNDLAPALLPDTLRRLLVQRRDQQELERARKEVTLDPEDLAIAQHQTLERLARSIPAGRRNTTLFAIGCDLRLYQVPNWEDALIARGSQLGLDASEMQGVVNHVKRYA